MAEFVLECGMFQAKVTEKSKTHNFFFRNFYGTARQATDNNMDAKRMLDK
jgi:hypothetical protein